MYFFVIILSTFFTTILYSDSSIIQLRQSLPVLSRYYKTCSEEDPFDSTKIEKHCANLETCAMPYLEMIALPKSLIKNRTENDISILEQYELLLIHVGRLFCEEGGRKHLLRRHVQIATEQRIMKKHLPRSSLVIQRKALYRRHYGQFLQQILQTNT